MKIMTFTILSMLIFSIFFFLVSCNQIPQSADEIPDVTSALNSHADDKQAGIDIISPTQLYEDNNSGPASTNDLNQGKTTKVPDKTYLGTWYTDKYELDDLVIFDITDEKIDFSMGIYRITSVTATANIDGNEISFVASWPAVSGRMEFYENSIHVIIDKSEFEYIHAGMTYAFVVKADSLAYWHHHILKIYDSAQNADFDNKLEYSSSLIINEHEAMSFDLSYPQVADDSHFSEKLNKYYIDMLVAAQNEEAKYLELGVAASHGSHYSKKVLYAYYWGSVYTVIFNEYTSFEHAAYTPKCDNFDLSTGERLQLDDVFAVGFNAYWQRINDYLLNHYKDDERIHPRLRDGTAPFPPTDNFMLAPDGIAFVFQQGEIASESSGTVIAFVDYEAIADILAIDT